MAHIRFGPSGWRSVFCEDFTFDNVRILCQAIADHLLEAGVSGRGVVIGYDSRFMGKTFAQEAVRILAGSGIPSFLCDRDTPTPVIAFELLRRQAAGGINFTASHNPSEYNGMKFSSAWGGLALPGTTREIEHRANQMLGEVCYRGLDLESAAKQRLFETISPQNTYLQQLENRIDCEALSNSGLTFATNTMYGTGRGYLDTFLRRLGLPVHAVNDQRDPTFGGFPPEPVAAYMADFVSLVRADRSISLGLATDCDADRYGIVDSDGTFIEPNHILALLADYLLRRGEKGDLARSVATSHLLDAVADFHGVKVYETPVGFKYIGELIAAEKILLGGEESAGFSMRGHVPEKDGILACLKVAEMVAVEGKSLQVLLAELYSRVGTFHTRRINVTLSPEIDEKIANLMTDQPDTFADIPVEQIVMIDGAKLILPDGSWVLFRKSGTEPVVRIYIESRTAEDLERLVSAAVKLLS